MGYNLNVASVVLTVAAVLIAITVEVLRRTREDDYLHRKRKRAQALRKRRRAQELRRRRRVRSDNRLAPQRELSILKMAIEVIIAAALVVPGRRLAVGPPVKTMADVLVTLAAWLTPGDRRCAEWRGELDELRRRDGRAGVLYGLQLFRAGITLRFVASPPLSRGAMIAVVTSIGVLLGNAVYDGVGYLLMLVSVVSLGAWWRWGRRRGAVLGP